ncbi:MAG: hypothetical protein E7654_08385 [Ruminococcaceae bacterium]|nr:hypothetical protein [Oscillospiraceae bacterium]
MEHVIKKMCGINIEFRPCPFCGNRPEWVEVDGNDFIMRCSSCHASTKAARWTPEEAAADWNATEIEDDHYTITEDTKIDEYLEHGIKKVLFSEYSNRYSFPALDDGFLCSEAVIITNKMKLCIEPENTYLLYDEISEYGYDYYIRPMAHESAEITFAESKWENERLISLSFCCDGRTITISASAEYEGMIVREK